MLWEDVLLFDLALTASGKDLLSFRFCRPLLLNFIIWEGGTHRSRVRPPFCELRF